MNRVSARSLVPVAASLAGHALLLALLLARLVGDEPAAAKAPSSTEIPISLEVPPPPPPAWPAGTGGGPGPGVQQPTVARAGVPHPLHTSAHMTGGPRLRARASAITDPYANLVISLDADRSGEGGGDGQPGSGGIAGGLSGLGGLGGLGMPGPLPPLPDSAARPPSPRYNYRDVMIHGSHQYSGRTVRLDLSIDAHGVVRGGQVTESVEHHLDLKALRYALHFEFEPALDAAGHPTAGRFPWSFVIQG